MQDISNPQEIATIEMTFYNYYPETLTDTKDLEAKVGINEDNLYPEIYDTLFR